MATTVTEIIPGELIGEQKAYPVRLRLTIQEHWVEELERPAQRIIEKIEPMSLAGVPEGEYTLHFQFEAEPQEQRARISYGFLLFE